MASNASTPDSTRRARSAFTYAWLVASVIVVCFPIYYVLEGSLTPTSWLEKGLPGLLPIHLTLDNFKHATEIVPLGQQFVNSVLVTLAQTIGQVVIAIMSAYALVFCNLKAARFVFLVLLSTMMIPAETIIIDRILMCCLSSLL